MIRIGEITQPSPRHNNSEDYRLTRKDVINYRVRYLRPILKDKEESVRVWTKEMMITTGRAHDLAASMLLDAIHDKDKIDKEIKFNLSRMKFKEDTHQGYDIARIKTIPMDKITRILPNGFFINNPFRNEQSPSNSLHWYKPVNRFSDFATNQNGDVIDLYMAINKVDLKTALKELSNYQYVYNSKQSINIGIDTHKYICYNLLIKINNQSPIKKTI